MNNQPKKTSYQQLDKQIYESNDDEYAENATNMLRHDGDRSDDFVIYDSDDDEYPEEATNELRHDGDRSDDFVIYDSDDDEYPEEATNELRHDGDRSDDFVIYDSDDDEYPEEATNELRHDGDRSDDFVIYDSDDDEYPEEATNELRHDGDRSDDFVIYDSDDDEYPEEATNELRHDGDRSDDFVIYDSDDDEYPEEATNELRHDGDRSDDFVIYDSDDDEYPEEATNELRHDGDRSDDFVIYDSDDDEYPEEATNELRHDGDRSDDFVIYDSDDDEYPEEATNELRHDGDRSDDFVIYDSDDDEYPEEATNELRHDGDRSDDFVIYDSDDDEYPEEATNELRHDGDRSDDFVIYDSDDDEYPEEATNELRHDGDRSDDFVIYDSDDDEYPEEATNELRHDGDRSDDFVIYDSDDDEYPEEATNELRHDGDRSDDFVIYDSDDDEYPEEATNELRHDGDRSDDFVIYDSDDDEYPEEATNELRHDGDRSDDFVIYDSDDDEYPEEATNELRHDGDRSDDFVIYDSDDDEYPEEATNELRHDGDRSDDFVIYDSDDDEYPEEATNELRHDGDRSDDFVIYDSDDDEYPEEATNELRHDGDRSDDFVIYDSDDDEYPEEATNELRHDGDRSDDFVIYDSDDDEYPEEATNELRHDGDRSDDFVIYDSDDDEYPEEATNELRHDGDRSDDFVIYDSDDDEYPEEATNELRHDGDRSADFVIYDSDNDECPEEATNELRHDGDRSDDFVIYDSDDDEYPEEATNELRHNGDRSTEFVIYDSDNDEHPEEATDEIQTGVICHNLNICIDDDLDQELIDQIYKNEKKIVGRRIVDINALFEQIKTLNQHSEHCGFSDMILTNEMKKGMNSIFEFRCKVCGVFKKINSCNENEHSLGTNDAAVLGITSVGLGFYALEEFFALLNIPCMTYNKFNTISKSQQAEWWTLAKKMASNALQEEIRLAVLHNEVDKFGNALITIACDGSWAKRSYGKMFSSLSGCAVIIGLRTKKIIYFDTRNKYCHVCRIARSKNSPANYHICNANYSGPSSAMETQIIVAGFKESISNGVRYHKFIGDGDSNTYKAIRDLRIYDSTDQHVEKYECRNHLYRNFRSSFGTLQHITKFNIDCRKLVTPRKCEEICKGVAMATKHWQKSNLPLHEKVINLEADIINAPSHYFGVHTKCKQYFCRKNTNQEDVVTLNWLKDDGIFYEILNFCQKYFANNVKSLLEGYSTNLAEAYGLVAKYLGGKRINYSLAGSYNARVATAVVQFNSEGKAGSEYQKFKIGDSLESNIATLELARKQKCEVNTKRNELKPRNRHIEADKTRKYYGESCEKPDMELAQYEIAKERLVKRLKENQKNREFIQITTIGQRHNPQWFQIRQHLLPSSQFAAIVNAKGRKSYTKILEEILYKRTEFGNSADVRHQRIYEQDALASFKSLKPNFLLEQCGIFIDQDLYFLCASPFMVNGSDFILSIKCPRKAFRNNLNEAIEAKRIPFWKMVDGTVVVNNKSNWYIEIQADLHITRRKYAILMVWLSESEHKSVVIFRDDDYWETQLKPKLTYFYEEVMIKELIDSRKARNMELRNYDSNSQTFI